MKVMILNGCNLNMIGIREKQVYGEADYSALCEYVTQQAADMQIDIVIQQHNDEGGLIQALQDAYFHDYDGVVLNAGAYACYSYALYDAIKSIQARIPVIEVHLSNMHDREAFRSQSVIAKACLGYIGGFGFTVYKLGLIALLEHWQSCN